MTTTKETKVTWDAEESLFILTDRDGDVVDGYETEEEAIQAKAEQDEQDTEADYDAQVYDVQNEIQGMVDGCDNLALLMSIRAMLAR